MRDESSNVVQPPEETTNLFFCSRVKHLLYSFYFCRIDLDTFSTNNKAQQLSGSHSESAFIWIQPQSEFPKPFKQLLQMNQVLFFSMRLCNHVVDIHFNLFVNHVVKKSHHGTLIRCPCVFQPKRHDFIAESSPRCDKCCFLHVFWCHLDLIVPREAIHEGKHFERSSIIHQHINMGKRKIIFRTRPIQISVINTHRDLSVLLRYRNNIRNPRRVIHNLQKASIKLFLNLFLNLLGHIWASPSKLLLDRRTIFLERQTVYHNIRIKTW